MIPRNHFDRAYVPQAKNHIMYDKRIRNKNFQTEVHSRNTMTRGTDRTEFGNYLKAVKTARDNISNFQQRENFLSDYFKNEALKSLPSVERLIQTPGVACNDKFLY